MITPIVAEKKKIFCNYEDVETYVETKAYIFNFRLIQQFLEIL